MTAEELAAMMLDLQDHGYHNINFVSPSMWWPRFSKRCRSRPDMGSGCLWSTTPAGYDSPEALALLDGVIDIYMPDMKYGDSAMAHRYFHVRNY